ncbi:MAG: hypothetical protein LUH63_00105 [Parabacteroides sp.]|nr:hypothetical protein [Parabacteroides sp.]
MKTTPLPLLLLYLLLLSPSAKAEGSGPNEGNKTNWQEQLASVSVGTDATSTDVQVTITDNDTLYAVKTNLGLAWVANITNNNDSVYKEGGAGYQPLYPHQKGFMNCTVKLNADIDLDAHYWMPIGKSSSSFYGTFDGNHKVIKGLKIDIEDTNTTNIYVGLFGYLRGDVRDLGIQVAAAGIKVKSKIVYAGALAGYNYGGFIQNCFAIGESDAAIDVESTSSEKLGGLIGENSGGSITNCYATLDVKGTLNGYTASIGGLVGYSQGIISHVYATGKIQATGQAYSQMGGVAGYIVQNTLSHALAANQEGITAANTTTSDFLGRVCGKVNSTFNDTHCDTATCYASTKIRMNNKVTGVGEDTNGKYFDGINADTDTDLSKLFPTEGADAVWEYSCTSNGNNTDNLPILKGFTSNLQGTTAKTDVFDSPLDLSTLTANSGTSPTSTNETQTFVADSLIFSNTEGWMHRQGTAEQRTAFSGRVKGTGTAVQLAIKTDTAAVLSFANGTVLTGPTTDYKSAINIAASQTEGKKTDVTLCSEGTVTVKSGGNTQAVFSQGTSTCHVDPKNRFLFYGIISRSGGNFYGMIGWEWEVPPTADVTVNWDGGSVTIPCDNDNSYKAVATNPDGDNITVRVGKDFQKGQLEGMSTYDYVSTFTFNDQGPRAYAVYNNMTSAADKGTADNPYVIDLATMSTSATAADSGYTYSEANNRKIVTLGCADGMTEAYYSIENKAAAPSS